MVTLDVVHPLTDFQQHTASYVRRLKKTGRPEVLTVNGKPTVVVQDARSYQRLLEEVERAETLVGIKRGLESMESGKGRPARAVFARMRKKYRIPRAA
jgi:prevent-host-death family protein